MKLLPKARSREIVVQSIGKETLVYDLAAHKAYNLNETSAIVYHACDGKTSFEELIRKHKFNDDLISLALNELQNNKLIESEKSFLNGISRREAVRKVGLASLAAIPVIVSLSAPTAAQSASCACTVTTVSNGSKLTPGDFFVAGCKQADQTACNILAQTVAVNICTYPYDIEANNGGILTACCTARCGVNPILFNN